MRNPNRGLGAVVVFVSVVVASCFSAPQLSASLQEVITLSQGSYDFGIVAVNGPGSASPQFVVSPAGSDDDDYITSITLASCGSEFALNLQPPLGSGSGSGSAHVFNMCSMFGGGTYGSGTTCIPVTYSFGAMFTPHSPGAQSCNVNIATFSGSGAGPGSQVIQLFGSGQSPSYSMMVSPPSIDFGDVTVGVTSSPRNVTVQNTGSATINVMGTKTGVTPTAFGTPALNTMLGAGSAATFMVTCSPSATTTYGATLTFITGSNEGNLSGMTTLRCRGVVTSLIVAPNPIDYGALLLGVAPATKSVVITNGGTSPVTLSSFRLTGSASADLSLVNPPSTANLSAGSNVTVQVAYSATTPQAYGPLGTFTFDVGSGSGSDMNVAITGGVEPGSIGTNPASVNLGPICAGGSASADITVFANSAGTVKLTSAMPPNAPFTVTSATTLPADLQHNHGNEVTFTASVHTTAEADLSDKLTLSTNIPNTPPREIALSAHVLPAGISPTPSEIRFGAVAVGMSSAAKQVTLTNCSGGPLMVTGAHLAGANASDFVAPPVDPITVPPMQSAMFLVLMSPHSNGAKTATFVIEHSSGTSIVAIDGTGFAGTDPGTPGERETYYGCSTSQVGALSPIVFALGLFVLRRRRKR